MLEDLNHPFDRQLEHAVDDPRVCQGHLLLLMVR